MFRNQRTSRNGGIGRFIVIALILYALYRWYFSQEVSIQASIQNNEEQLHLQQIQNSSGFFSLIFSLITAIPSLIWSIVTTILGFFWWIIQKIWLIKVIWIIFMLVVNIAFIGFAYYVMKKQQRESELYLKFVVGLAIMVIIPLLINRFLVHQILAYYIFLPIDLTLFVDSVGKDAMYYQTVPRNLVFFVILCSFI